VGACIFAGRLPWDGHAPMGWALEQAPVRWAGRQCGMLRTPVVTALGLMVAASDQQQPSPGGIAGPDVDNGFLGEILKNLSQLRRGEQWFQWRNELFSQQTVDYRDEAAVRAWHAAIYRQFGRRLVGRRPCTLDRPLYVANAAPHNLPVSVKVWCGDAICGNR